jgi:4-hydroxy-tetrahydrodipicolinate synthase
VTEAVNGRLPVVLGCSGNSIPQVLQFAEAAGRTGADAIVAMAPANAGSAASMDMFRRLADRYEGPIILQNAANYSPLTGEQVATLVHEVPSIEYIKEERPPGPRHISEIHRLVGDKVKTIFGGVGGKMMPEELSRGAGGCMPACQLADVLAAVMELWWKGEEGAARELHQRVLPLIVRETHPFMRYILSRRGVFTSQVERAGANTVALDADDEREISTLLEPIADVITAYPFGAEQLVKE